MFNNEAYPTKVDITITFHLKRIILYLYIQDVEQYIHTYPPLIHHILVQMNGEGL